MARSFSIQDGNLNTVSLVTSRSVNYIDVDLKFDAKPSGDIYKKTDAAAVNQAVKNILLTNHGEKPFKPSFGGNLSNLLFELIDADAEDYIDEAIKLAIRNHEPRANVIGTNFNINPDANTIRLQVEFQILNTEEIVTLKTTITRIR